MSSPSREHRGNPEPKEDANSYRDADIPAPEVTEVSAEEETDESVTDPLSTGLP